MAWSRRVTASLAGYPRLGAFYPRCAHIGFDAMRALLGEFTAHLLPVRHTNVCCIALRLQNARLELYRDGQLFVNFCAYLVARGVRKCTTSKHIGMFSSAAWQRLSTMAFSLCTLHAPYLHLTPYVLMSFSQVLQRRLWNGLTPMINTHLPGNC